MSRTAGDGKDTMIEPFYVAFDAQTGLLVVKGELDESTARHVYDVDLGDSHVEHIDLSGVSFLSAGGITALLDRCRSRPTTMTASPAARRIIEICELGETFLMNDSSGR